MPRWSIGAFGLSLAALTLACASEPRPAPTGSGSIAPPVAEGIRRVGENTRPRMPGEQQKIPASGIPDPLAGLGDRELCAGTPAQLMLKYELGALQTGQCHDVCCPLDSAHWCCELDYPFSDVPPCEAWSVMRNEIFARYGYPFKEARWREEFESEPWYSRREDFSDTWLSTVAARNIATLKEYELRGVQCLQ